jgi:hypothetical protein
MFRRDPLAQVLTLKIGKLASEKSGIALNIPPVAQNFGGPEVNHRRHRTEMAHTVLRMGIGEFAASADSTAQLRVRPATRPIGNIAQRPYKEKPRCGRGLRFTVRHLKSPVSPSNPIHNADDCGKDCSGTKKAPTEPGLQLSIRGRPVVTAGRRLRCALSALP